MMKAFIVLMLTVTCLSMQSCDNKTIDQEVEEYCDCKQQALSGAKNIDECHALANQISNKYQFDPAAVEEIGEKIKKCADELNDQND